MVTYSLEAVKSRWLAPAAGLSDELVSIWATVAGLATFEPALAAEVGDHTLGPSGSAVRH